MSICHKTQRKSSSDVSVSRKGVMITQVCRFCKNTQTLQVINILSKTVCMAISGPTEQEYIFYDTSSYKTGYINWALTMNSPWLKCNAEEADTRIWLHVERTAMRKPIYSPNMLVERKKEFSAASATSSVSLSL